MNSENPQKTKILSRITSAEFVGREYEFSEILRHAKGETDSSAMILLSPPAAGVSELLRQIYDRLFQTQSGVIPVYFSFSKNDRTAEQAARRFLQVFLTQVIAFRRADAELLNTAPDVCELTELAHAADVQWIERLTAACEKNSRLKDERSFIRQAFSAPLRAKAGGAQIVLFLDNFHYVENFKGEVNLLDELKEIYQRPAIPFVWAGRRRYVLDAVQSGNTRFQKIEIIKLDYLPVSAAGTLIENAARENQTAINEQTRDLIIRQFGGNPFFITSLFFHAPESGKNLDSFQKVEKVYVDALLGGRIGKFYGTIFDEIMPKKELQKAVVELLAKDAEKLPVEVWRKRLNISDEEFYEVIRLLHVHEIIRLNSGLIEFSDKNEVLRDYVESRYRLEIVGEQRALVVGTLLSEVLKRAPYTMLQFYRRASAIGLRELLGVFDCQPVSLSFLNYEDFKTRHKGAEDAEILTNIEKETETVKLPQIVYTANCAAFYPPINQFSDEDRAAAAIGFETGNYTDENQIVWIAAEIDSKLEAGKELAEFWCDRLEMVALMCNFINYQLWLVTPEGFSPEACEVLKQRNAFGSSRRQIELLAKHLKAENVVREKLKANEYEMIVPMGDDTEMIAAHAVEEIARRHSFQPKAITQIKTALVEACINAAEHGLSPDRKIYQKITVEDDKIIITISNRGIKIPSNKVAESVMQIEPSEGRRGWGLKLMRNLMDEVKFERVDDGTRISMTKYLKNS